ncbi:MAG: hypothetical protein ACTSUE_00485 [Promethearchaeota archaeon]
MKLPSIIGNSIANSLFFAVFSNLGLSSDFVYVLSKRLKVIGLLLITHGGAHFNV